MTEESKLSRETESKPDSIKRSSARADSREVPCNRGTSLVFKILGFAESGLGYDKEGPTALVRIA